MKSAYSFVATKPAVALVVLDDAVLNHNLRAIHQVPAIERLAIEKADESLFSLIGAQRDVRHAQDARSGNGNNGLGDTASVVHGLHLGDGRSLRSTGIPE
jgi:hypothetical protein